jgi:hypothetical protein
MAFELLDFTMQGRKRQPGEQTEFRRVRVLQRFRWNGRLLCQRIDRCRARDGSYNAMVLDGGGSSSRVYIMDHEIVTIVD